MFISGILRFFTLLLTWKQAQFCLSQIFFLNIADRVTLKDICKLYYQFFLSFWVELDLESELPKNFSIPCSSSKKGRLWFRTIACHSAGFLAYRHIGIHPVRTRVYWRGGVGGGGTVEWPETKHYFPDFEMCEQKFVFICAVLLSWVLFGRLWAFEIPELNSAPALMAPFKKI